MFEHDMGLIPIDADEVLIRRAVISDLPKLEWFGQYRHYRMLFQKTFEEHLAGRRQMLVADVEGFPIGQIVIQFISARRHFADGCTRGYLYALRVMPLFQRRGIGTCLVRWAEQSLLERDYLWSTIAVAKTNTGARRLYERLDYRIFTEDPGRWHYTDPEGNTHQVVEPSWVLEKRLSRHKPDSLKKS